MLPNNFPEKQFTEITTSALVEYISQTVNLIA